MNLIAVVNLMGIILFPLILSLRKRILLSTFSNEAFDIHSLTFIAEP